MIKTYLFSAAETREDVPLEDWRMLIEGHESLLWVDARSPGPEELHRLAEAFGLQPEALRSCMDSFHRPRLHEYADHFYLNLTVVRGADRSGRGIKASELHLFVGEKFVIALSENESAPAVERALAEYMANPTLCRRGAIYAAYVLAEDLTETYLAIAEKLDAEADRLETAMLDRADKATMRKTFVLKSRVFELRKLLGPQRDVFGQIVRRDFPFERDNSTVHFQDVYNRMIRVFDVLDTVREVLSNSLDIYLSTVSNRLNEVMKVLTVAATILMTLSLIAGFYGMNFVHLPWLRAPNAFRNMCIFMGVLTALMLAWFKWKDWI